MVADFFDSSIKEEFQKSAIGGPEPDKIEAVYVYFESNIENSPSFRGATIDFDHPKERGAILRPKSGRLSPSRTTSSLNIEAPMFHRYKYDPELGQYERRLTRSVTTREKVRSETSYVSEREAIGAVLDVMFKADQVCLGGMGSEPLDDDAKQKLYTDLMNRYTTLQPAPSLPTVTSGVKL